jgi:hypothetical protein
MSSMACISGGLSMTDCAFRFSCRRVSEVVPGIGLSGHDALISSAVRRVATGTVNQGILISTRAAGRRTLRMSEGLEDSRQNQAIT